MKVNWFALRGVAKNEEVLLLPITVEEDEQWSFVGKKSQQRWLWVALNHRTSEILAYTFGAEQIRCVNGLKNYYRHLMSLNILRMD